MELNSAIVTVTDNQPPTLGATTGSLFATSGYQRGTVTGTVSGTDNSGVASVRVYVDGQPNIQSAFACDYTYAQPCPAAVTSPTLTLDTTRLADGPHQIQAAVVDAAGNETRGPVQQLLVANHPPGAPVGAAVVNAPPTGWLNHAATIAWKNPARGSGLPIAGVDWITCRGLEATIPTTGCGALHAEAMPLTSLSEDPRTESVFAASLPSSYTVFVWLVDSSGDLDPAATAHVGFGFDNTAPGPPVSLDATPTGKAFLVRATPAAHVAPISAVSWTACRTGGRCTAPRVVAGQAFGFNPATNSTFRSSPRGSYVLRAWLLDAAGNQDPSATATTTVVYTSSAVPNARHGARSPGLRLMKVSVHGRAVSVTGSLARSFHGRVRVVLDTRVGSTNRPIRRSATVAAGHFATEVVGPAGALLEKVTVTFGGDKTFRPQTVTRTLAHR